jgi:peptide/nickel transport system permease protein
MAAFIVRRLASTVLVMGIVGVFIFLLLHLSPGDPAAIIAGDNATPEQIAAIRRKLGLDDRLHNQFLRWASGVLQGDLGISIFSNEPVLTLVQQRIEPTLSLALTTIMLAVTLAITAGVLAAWKVGTWVDRGVMVLSVLGFSVPVFVVGYVLIYVFAITLGWLPVQGYTPIAEGILPWLRNLVLPSIALGLAYVALIARITRTAMLDVLAEDYVRTAQAKGVATPPLLLKHALKNAGVPIVTVIGIGVALLIGGVVITETVFNIPGIGRLVVDAISKRDYPIIQGVILIFSGVYVIVNLLVDLTYTVLDPRIRY